MKPVSLFAVLVFVCATNGLAQAPIITSFNRNGELTWTNTTTNAVYQLEWASSLDGPWRKSWQDLTAVDVAPRTQCTVDVPMFYRVVLPSLAPGTWRYTASYTASNDSNPAQWDWSEDLVLNADGSLGSFGLEGFWCTYTNALILVHPWRQDASTFGADCAFLTLASRTNAAGPFEDKNVTGSGWWGRGNAGAHRISSMCGLVDRDFHPASLHGAWRYTAAYTEASGGNPAQWNWSAALTLNSDGSVGTNQVKGAWWAYMNVLLIVHPWQQGSYYGADCSWLNVTSSTSATGVFEDKNMSGSGWWGRGNATLQKQ